MLATAHIAACQARIDQSYREVVTIYAPDLIRPKRHLDPFSRFCTIYGCAQNADRHTDTRVHHAIFRIIVVPNPNI